MKFAEVSSSFDWRSVIREQEESGGEPLMVAQRCLGSGIALAAEMSANSIVERSV